MWAQYTLITFKEEEEEDQKDATEEGKQKRKAAERKAREIERKKNTFDVLFLAWKMEIS